MSDEYFESLKTNQTKKFVFQSIIPTVSISNSDKNGAGNVSSAQSRKSLKLNPSSNLSKSRKGSVNRRTPGIQLTPQRQKDKPFRITRKSVGCLKL